MENIKIIGITGSICSGKSAMSDYLRNNNYIVLDMDTIARNEMTNNKSVISEIKKAFGDEAYINNGETLELNSKYIAQIAFNDDKKLEELNRITHPPTISATLKEIESLSEEANNLIFVENALLFEMGLDEGFDFIIAVTAPENIRLKRAHDRGISESDFKKRQKAQIEDKEKCECSDFVIDNNKDLEGFYSTIDFIVDIIKEM